MSNKLNRTQPPQSPTPQITPELLERMLSIQEAELATRAKEFEIRQLEITKGHEFSTEGLNAQITDRQNAREAKQKGDNAKYIFTGIIVGIVVIFLVIALYINKDAIALEVVKGAILVAAGYLGGKYHQKSKDEKTKSE